MGQNRPSDEPARIARELAGFTHVHHHNVLLLGCSTASAQQRLEAAERAFQVWGRICALMSELERACPNASDAGYAQAARLREVVERAHDAAAAIDGVS